MTSLQSAENGFYFCVPSVKWILRINEFSCLYLIVAIWDVALFSVWSAPFWDDVLFALGVWMGKRNRTFAIFRDVERRTARLPIWERISVGTLERSHLSACGVSVANASRGLMSCNVTREFIQVCNIRWCHKVMQLNFDFGSILSCQNWQLINLKKRLQEQK